MASISTCITIPTRSPYLISNSFFTSKPPNLFKPHNSFSNFHNISWKLTSPRVSVLSLRASIDVSTGIRPGAAVETDKLPKDIRNRTMEAVDASGGRVTIGDVASRAGIKLNEAQKALQALAADTDGFLEVSEDGDVLYVFPKDYRSKLAGKSFRMKIEPFIDRTKAAAEYLIRVSFGTALIASIVIVYTSIIVLLSSRSEEDNRGRRGGRSYNSGFTFYLSPTDLFWYWDPYYRRRRAQVEDDEKMNFIESVFSFVFGDGDPNQGIEEKRWKLIGQYIASNGGVVTAEELAPYLDVTKEDMAASEAAAYYNIDFPPMYVTPNKEEEDESYILPVLLRFDGQPEIDEEGNILYRFPSLQRTGSSQRSSKKEYVGKRWADWVGGVEKYLKEKALQFSKTGTSERAMVIGLGGLNLFGVLILGTMLKDVAGAPTGFIQFVSSIFPLLQVYAGSFFAIPLVRWFLVSRKNKEIEERNQAREQFARALELPNLSLRRKLLSARDMSQRTVIGQDNIIYTTDRDIIEQDVEAREWDRRFQELEKSD